MYIQNTVRVQYALVNAATYSTSLSVMKLLRDNNEALRN